MKFRIAFGALFFAISTYGQAATYYVDPAIGNDTTGTGTQAFPWKSIPGSRNVADTGALPTHTLAPGDVVEVKRGSIFGTATSVGRLEFTQNGTAASPIIIRCSTTWGIGACRFSGAGVITGGYFGLVTFLPTSYVTFKGFTITASEQEGLLVQGDSHHITIDSNTIASSVRSGIVVNVTRTLPMFLRIINNTILNSGVGCIIFAQSTGGYNLIEGNTITDTQGTGNYDSIQLRSTIADTQYTVIRNNTITNNAVATNGAGDTIDTSGHGITHHFLIEGNKVSNSKGNLKFHCGIAESSLDTVYSTQIYGSPGSAGWYSAGTSCHSVVRYNVWQDQAVDVYNYPMPIAYYNNTTYRQTQEHFALAGRACSTDGQPAGLTFGDSTYPGGGSEKGVFAIKNNIWWSEPTPPPHTTFTQVYSLDPGYCTTKPI